MEINIKKQDIMRRQDTGFSLAEAMMALLIAALILAATMPVITKKHLILPKRGPHGKWACKLINGQMYSATGADQNSTLPPDNKWKKGCKFPVLPSNVAFMLIQTIGGGAGGNPQEGEPSLTFLAPTDVFEIPDYEDGTLEIPVSGEYEVTVKGNRGESGQMKPRGFRARVDGIVVAECIYDESNIPAPAGKDNASIRFRKKYEAGDELWTESLADDSMETQMIMCTNTYVPNALVTYPNGMTKRVNYTFLVMNSYAGKNGDTVKLWEKQYKTQNKGIVAEIEGTGGGMYRSNYSADSCNYINCNRYIGVQRKYRTAAELVKLMPSGSTIIPGSTESSRARAADTIVELKGGCGGEAGTVNSILYPRQEEYENTIQIGRGGAEGNDGEMTKFNWVTAKGGSGCSSTTDIGIGDYAGIGGDGANADTASKNDSIGGKGGRGGINMATPGNGENGRGMGSAGGGGGAAINLTKPRLGTSKNKNQSTRRYSTKFGIGGAGASGGIIVSW